MDTQRATAERHLQHDISLIVRGLLGVRALQQKDLAVVLGIGPSGVAEKLAGRRKWSIDDIDVMCRYFDVSPATFFDDPESLFRSRCFAPTVVELPDEQMMLDLDDRHAALALAN